MGAVVQTEPFFHSGFAEVGLASKTKRFGDGIRLFSESLRNNKLAEGVGSDPFLPSGDPSRKVGFAPSMFERPACFQLAARGPVASEYAETQIGC